MSLLNNFLSYDHEIHYVSGVLAMQQPVHSADLYVIGVCDTLTVCIQQSSKERSSWTSQTQRAFTDRMVFRVSVLIVEMHLSICFLFKIIIIIYIFCTGKSCAAWRAWPLTLKRRTWGTCGSLSVWRCASVRPRAWRSAACLRERWGTPFHCFKGSTSLTTSRFVIPGKDYSLIFFKWPCSNKMCLVFSHSWLKVKRQKERLSMTWSSPYLISRMLGPEETW